MLKLEQAGEKSHNILNTIGSKGASMCAKDKWGGSRRGFVTRRSSLKSLMRKKKQTERGEKRPNDVRHQISLIDCSSLTNSSCLCMTK